MTALRANRNWQKLWLGQTISQLGDYVFDTTLVLWVGTDLVRGKSYGPIAVSGVLIAAVVPTVLVGPLAGVFVDRWNRKRTMLLCDALRAALIGFLIVVATGLSSLPVGLRLAAIYAVVALASALAQFFNPSRFATIGAVIDPDDRPRAFSLSSATTSAAAVIGPPIAAPVLFSAGAQWALVINCASFLASFALIWWTRIPSGDRGAEDRLGGGFTAELREGWAFIRGNTVLTTLLTVIFLYMFGVGVISVLEVFFVSENLHVAATWLGTLNGALGAGSIVGALLAPRIAKKTGDRAAFGWGILATAILVAGLGLTSQLALAIAVEGLIGVPLAVVNTVLSPILLDETPNRLLGRVSALLNPAVSLASISSMAIAGLVASALGTGFSFSVADRTFHRIDTLFLVSGLLMAIAGIIAVRRLSRAKATGFEPDGLYEPSPVSEAK